MVATHILEFTCCRNLVAGYFLVFFNVFSQEIFLAILASDGCTFTDPFQMFLDEQCAQLSILL
jgi:hypothetical protein